MLDFLNQIDQSIFLFFNGMHTPFLDRCMMMFTGRFIWVPMYATILIVILRTHGIKSTWIYVLGIALAITITDQACASYIRPVVERLRPSNLENPLSAMAIIVDDYRGGDYGFPSCHSANSFALATFLTCMFPRWRMGLFIFGWAVVNSYTRLYLGVHYPGDLFVGAVIGSLLGWLCCMMTRHIDHSIFHNTDAESIDRLNLPLFTFKFAWSNGNTTRLIKYSVCDLLISVGAITSLAIVVIAIIN